MNDDHVLIYLLKRNGLDQMLLFQMFPDASGQPLSLQSCHKILPIESKSIYIVCWCVCANNNHRSLILDK